MRGQKATADLRDPTDEPRRALHERALDSLREQQRISPARTLWRRTRSRTRSPARAIAIEDDEGIQGDWIRNRRRAATAHLLMRDRAGGIGIAAKARISGDCRGIRGVDSGNE